MNNKRQKLVRITTVPISIEKLLDKQLHFMQGYYDVIAVSSDLKKMQQIGALQKVRFFCVDLTRQITPIKDLKALLRLYRFLKKERPFIVHTHTPKAGTIGMIAAQLAGVPHRLHTVAGLPLLETTGKKRKLLNLVERLTYACATKVYPNSYGLKDIIIHEKFCASSKLKVIGNGSSNGINTEYFSRRHFSDGQRHQLRASLGIVVDDFVFVFVGRIVPDKGINELIAAFTKLHSEHKHVKLLLVGSKETTLYPLEQAIEEQIDRHPAIITVGYQEDVRPYFVTADALAFPSYREGFPNVVMQAGAMDLPVIVTNINGCNEIVIEGKNGLIIPVKNSETLYLAMKELLTNKEVFERLSTNARSSIKDRYEQLFVWNELLKEYRSLEE